MLYSDTGNKHKIHQNSIGHPNSTCRQYQEIHKDVDIMDPATHQCSAQCVERPKGECGKVNHF